MSSVCGPCPAKLGLEERFRAGWTAHFEIGRREEEGSGEELRPSPCLRGRSPSFCAFIFRGESWSELPRPASQSGAMAQGEQDISWRNYGVNPSLTHASHPPPSHAFSQPPHLHPTPLPPGIAVDAAGYPASFERQYLRHPHSLAVHVTPGQQKIHTLFVSGLPDDVKPREIHNLFRRRPGFESCQLKYTGRGDQVRGVSSSLAFLNSPVQGALPLNLIEH